MLLADSSQIEFNTALIGFVTAILAFLGTIISLIWDYRLKKKDENIEKIFSERIDRINYVKNSNSLITQLVELRQRIYIGKDQLTLEVFGQAESILHQLCDMSSEWTEEEKKIFSDAFSQVDVASIRFCKDGYVAPTCMEAAKTIDKVIGISRKRGNEL